MMLRQIKTLTRLELCNLYGLNVYRFAKDRKVTGKSLGLLIIWITLIVILMFYMGGLSYGLICLGMEKAVLPYLLALSGALIFVFGIMKTGSILFRKEGYDMLCALPVSETAIVIGRLLRIYAEELSLTLAVLLPGIAVYAWNIGPGPGFYITLLFSLWFMPLIPGAGAILIGVLITGISSRMRHKSLVMAGLSVLAVLGILYMSSRAASVEGNMDPERLKELSGMILEVLDRLYPPAAGLGNAIVEGDLRGSLGWVGGSAGAFLSVAAGVILCFRPVCRNLWSHPAGHRYKLGDLKTNSPLGALCKREFRRYLSSGIYVSNTIIGPVMGCVLSGILVAAGAEALTGFLPDFVKTEAAIPFVLAGIFGMGTTTAVSLSMEGKEWWILKSLPVSFKNILDAKIGMNLLLLAPFYLLSELLLVFALQPVGWELVWLILVPAVYVIFFAVFGITMNLHFPVLNWENEVRVVKQSASSMLSILGGMLLGFGGGVGAALISDRYRNGVEGGICLGLLFLTAVLYRRNCRSQIWEKL